MISHSATTSTNAEPAPLRVLLIQGDAGTARETRNVLTAGMLASGAPLSGMLPPGALLSSVDGPFVVEHAASVPAGLTRLRSPSGGDADVVLLDVSTSELAGLAALSRIRAQSPDVPVIVVSGADDPQLALEAVHGGAQDYLVQSQLSGALLARSLRYAVERHRTERALRESRRFAESVADAAPCILYIYDLDEKRNIYTNRQLETVLGYSRGEAERPGTTLFQDYFHPEDLPRILAAHQRYAAAKDGEIVETDYRMKHANGEWRWLCSRDTIFCRDAGGRPRQVLGAAVDITERKTAEESALQAQRLAAIGEMVTGLTHESRNALQRSNACLAMLALEVKALPQAHDLVVRLKAAQDHLQHLYESVRNYAAPISLRRQTCHLGDVLHAAWSHLELQRHGREAHLAERRHVSNLLYEADEFRLGEVFQNILENSLAACRDPVQIVAEWSAAILHGQPALQLSLRDNGPGLSEEQQQKIFQPFFTTKTRGTGLGMCLAQRIVEAHDGRIEAGCTDAGGTEIVIALPKRGP